MNRPRKIYYRNTPTERRCPKCEGAGTVVVNTTNPHGYGPDPQCDVDVPCTFAGCFDGWIQWAPSDPLEVMHATRRHWPARYAAARERAMRRPLMRTAP